MFLDIDVRAALPSVRAPTLLIQRRGDRVVDIHAGRWLADHIPDGRLIELPGRDHVPWAGDVDAVAGSIEEFLTGSRAAVAEDLDRVLATVLFIDIVGSTERLAALGDQRWRDLLEDCYATVRAELLRFRGREVKTTGDGVLATFDGPARAVRAAQAIVAAVRRIGIDVRAGLHTGECEMRGDDVVGIAVHTGARVAALAEANEVLVSSTVKDLVAGAHIVFKDRGEHELKGVPGRWRLYAAES
jgi:class 3 adenylate cyclase